MLDAADFDRLRLARTPRVGPVTYAALLGRFGSARAALEALPDLARRAGGGQPFRPVDTNRIEREAERVAALGGRYVFSDGAGYPPLLRALPGAPMALIVRGDRALMARPTIAIVGARNASAAACRFARMLAGDLGGRGYSVVSGLARGIDTAAHLGALPHATVGVIASGIDISFPRENAELQERIAAEHCLVSEYPPGTEPVARQFPHRNRIIAGLALGTIVVEAAPRSGSLLTARLATEAGREVMAVPGSPLDARAQGCNGLIRDGATLIQSADDVVEALGPIDVRMTAARVNAPPPLGTFASADPGDDARGRILGLLGPVAVMVDELVRQSGLDTAQVQMLLIELELAGRLERHAGARVSLADSAHEQA